MTRWVAAFVVLVVVLVVLSVSTTIERMVGATEAERDAAVSAGSIARRNRIASEARRDSIAALYTALHDAFVRNSASSAGSVARLRRAIDSLAARGPITDTVTVTVRAVDLANLDTLGQSCVDVVLSCDDRVAAERAVTAGVASERDAARKESNANRSLARRPWTATGLSWPVGVWIERDYWRLRGGATVGLQPDGTVRGELRIGVRW